MIRKAHLHIGTIVSVIVIALCPVCISAETIPSVFSPCLSWRVGTDISTGLIPGTNGFLRGDNPENLNISNALSGDIRADFSFDPSTREGMLYKDLYQGVGIGVNTFFANRFLGNPVSVYVYQGSPIVHFRDRFWLGYEWQFGAAFGWRHYDEITSPDNTAVSTPVTAHMGLGLKIHYQLSDRWQLSAGVYGRHYSNGNTSWPNDGLNSLGATVGIAYQINPHKDKALADKALEEAADRGRWFYDIVAYVAYRKRVVFIGEPAEAALCPGKFAVLGILFSPMRKLNRWVAVGPGLNLQWDESAALSTYWVDGTYREELKFNRPPFSKQISAGLSAHAELTMPIFAVNIGLGYDFINPNGNRAFFQSLSLKTFVLDNLYLNVGYRLGSFKEPQNLMLGLGLRL